MRHKRFYRRAFGCLWCWLRKYGQIRSANTICSGEFNNEKFTRKPKWTKSRIVIDFRGCRSDDWSECFDLIERNGSVFVVICWRIAAAQTNANGKRRRREEGIRARTARNEYSRNERRLDLRAVISDHQRRKKYMLNPAAIIPPHFIIIIPLLLLFSV